MAKKTLDGVTRRTSRQVGLQNSRRGTAQKSSTGPKRNRNRTSEIEEEAAINKILEDKKNQKKRRGDTTDFLKPVGVFNFDDDDIQKLEKEAAKKSGKRSEYRKNGKKKWSKKRKVITFSLLGLLLAFVVFVVVYFDAIIARLTSGNSGIGDLISVIVNDYVDLETDENGRTNVLLIGTSGYEMDGSGHDGAQLTDTVMLISFHEESGDVAMISIPRDFKVSGSCYSTGKINEIYSCGSDGGEDDAAGAAAIEATVSEILGVEIQYYAHVDWSALVQIVDTIGGITVTLDEDVNDLNYTGTVIRAGVPTELDGEAALGLARARHGTSSGDFTRAANQQKIIAAILTKVQEQGLGITDALSMVSTLGDNLRTDFTLQELKTIAHYGETFDVNNIRQISLYEAEDGSSYVTTATIGGISYVIPSLGDGRYTAIQAYVAAMLSTDPVERENAAILVLNGSGESGAASSEATKLENLGYNAANYSNAWSQDFTGYTIYALNSDKSQTIAALETLYGVSASDTSAIPSYLDYSDYDIIVVVGTSSD